MSSEVLSKSAKRICLAFLALTLYSAITYLAFVPHGISWTHDIFSPNGDAYIGIWSMNWWPFSIKNGINSFLTKYIWYPSGFNLAWAGVMPTLAFIGYPLTNWLGPIASYNILALSVYPLGAFGVYLLSKYLTDNYPAALFSGFLFGFSSYIVGQSLGHIVLSFVCLIPLAVLVAVKRFRGEIGRTIFIVVVALFVALEFGIYIEVVATATFFSSSYLLLYYYFNEKLRQRLRALMFELGAGFVLAIVILSPYLFYIIDGLSFVPNVINSPFSFSADLLNYIIPTPLAWVGGVIFTPISSRFTGNFSETGAYLGVIFVGVMVLSLRANLKMSWGMPLLYWLIFVAICSLGPYLQIGGVNTKIPLPWALFERTPLLGHALPTRFTLYIDLGASVLAAFWLSERALGRWEKILRYLIVLCALVMIFPATRPWPFGENGIPWAAAGTPQLFLDQAILKKYIKANDVVVILPYGSQGGSMLWQVQSGMYFRMAGGYVGFTPKQFGGLPAVNIFYNSNIPSDAETVKNAVASFCATHDVKAIILAPGTSPALSAAMQKLDWKSEQAGGVELIRVPPTAELKYSDIRGDYWQSVADWAWMGKTIAISNHGIGSTFYVKAEGLPPAVGPISLTVRRDGKVEYVLLTPGKGGVFSFKVGPFAAATITADRTWRPNKVIYNGDERQLSVLFKVEDSH
ncbi:MAG: hypothetical protein HIU89_00070 [Proteobacteria bacterium]|nr:hypothetical protein [Pseudomonadota bacterium]